MSIDLNWFYSQVGQLIRIERERKGISQEELGRRVQLTRTSITNIENGRQRLLIHTLWAIANQLKVDFSKLLPSIDHGLDEVLKNLPADYQRAVEIAMREENNNGAKN